MKTEGRDVSDVELVWNYVHSCTSGALKLYECRPVWQMGAIVVLLCAAIIAFVMVRVRSARSKAP